MPESEYLEAVILGVVQGIAEFLPISSSGHLVIFSEILHRLTGRQVSPEENMQLNVALHFGTLLSILVVYRRDIFQLRHNYRLCCWIVLATFPVALIGLTFKDVIEQSLQNPLTAGIFLILTAALLFAAHKQQNANVPLENLSWTQALTIGFFQAVAIIPGISRSGSTIAGGLVVGVRRDAATTFSFLIAIPAIMGAVVLTVADIASEKSDPNALLPLLIGAVVSFGVGYFALHWLIRLISHKKLHWFAWYCAFAGVSTVIWQLIEQ